MLARPARAGASIIELVVSMVILGVVLALVAAISVRQQRLYADVADAAALAGQMRDAAVVLPIDLRGVSSAAGDIRAGEARDTSIEVRSTIAGGVVCDTLGAALVLAPAAPGVVAYSSFLTTIDAGDTAWVFTPGDSADDWIPHKIIATSAAPPGACRAAGPRLDGAGRSAPRVAVTFEDPAGGAMVGAPLRVTRPLRYSLYRSSDGGWYLGERDWNTPAARFNTIQPVSGPFLSPALSGLSFHYFDSTGAELRTPLPDARAVAVISIDLRGQTTHASRALGAAGAAGAGGASVPRGDSVRVNVLLHNRR